VIKKLRHLIVFGFAVAGMVLVLDRLMRMEDEEYFPRGHASRRYP
jgi:hypothetical protein